MGRGSRTPPGFSAPVSRAGKPEMRGARGPRPEASRGEDPPPAPVPIPSGSLDRGARVCCLSAAASFLRGASVSAARTAACFLRVSGARSARGAGGTASHVPHRRGPALSVEEDPGPPHSRRRGHMSAGMPGAGGRGDHLRVRPPCFPSPRLGSHRFLCHVF